jgi:hypothetical protein
VIYGKGKFRNPSLIRLCDDPDRSTNSVHSRRVGFMGSGARHWRDEPHEKMCEIGGEPGFERDISAMICFIYLFFYFFFLYPGRMHPVARVTMNRNNESSLKTAFKRALLSRTMHYMFRLQFKPSSGVSNQNTKSNRNGSVVKQLNRFIYLFLSALSIYLFPKLFVLYGYLLLR